MLIASFSWSSPNNHESRHKEIPYSHKKAQKAQKGSLNHFVLFVPFCG